MTVTNVIACLAAIVFGMISANVRTTNSKIPEAMATYFSPNSSMVMTVTKEAAAILARLFPIKMVEI